METSLPAFVVYQEESLDSLLEEGRRKYIGEDQFASSGSSPTSPSTISQTSSTSHPSSPSFDSCFGSAMNIDETMSSGSSTQEMGSSPLYLQQFSIQQQLPLTLLMNGSADYNVAQFQQGFGNNQFQQQQQFQGSLSYGSTMHKNQQKGQDKSAPWTFVNNDSSVYEPEDLDHDGSLARKLICNGRIIRKNKKSQAYDQFIMKWVFK